MPGFIKLPSSEKARLNLLGTLIIAIGLCVAAGIWFAQDNPDADAQSGDQLATLDSRKQVRDVEIYYGQSGLLMEEFLEWFKSLAHGDRLAATVAVCSLIIGGGCFAVAGYFFTDLGPEGPPE